MWAQPAKPVTNTPELIVDFFTVLFDLIKDPTQLDPLVKAAQEIAMANQFTEAQNKAIADAEIVVTQAQTAAADMAAYRVSFLAKQDTANEKLSARERAVAVREQQADKRNSELAVLQAAHGARTNTLDSRETDLVQRELAATSKEAEQEVIHEALVEREQKVTAREVALYNAVAAMST